jgi:hypothetical protein
MQKVSCWVPINFAGLRKAGDCNKNPSLVHVVQNLIAFYVVSNLLRVYENKRSRKPKGQSSLDNLETLAILGIQEKDRQNTKQHRKLKRWATQIPLKTEGEPRCWWRVNSSCLLLDTRHVEFMMQHLMENNLEVINLFTVCNHQEMNN